MDPLRVMTFNVRVDLEADGADAWANRRDLVADTISYHAPDVICLQEPLARQVDDLDERLPGYDWVGRSREAAERAGEYAPVFYDADRFEPEERGTFWLSETGEPGGVGWDATHPRIATWVRLADAGSRAAGGFRARAHSVRADDERGDRPLLVCNTHLDHEGERARREGAALVADRVADLAVGAGVVVTGDLNCEAGDPPHDRLAGAELDDGRHLVDAVAAADDRHGPATSRTDFHELVPDRRIDHVLVADDARVDSAVTLTDRDQRRYPSDHLPVAVDLR
ncbi:endonuclease/exonuclease/phosphatase family protein [Halomicrobium urmianum]|uniref:endonuclease/exonuclease/phosphatase family protein n=1 Tax=Halomicrobium urmianum TaxID=1586233 RepID=UPI001CDA2775|nr:endonuclease/exonuclease/phosphatase family protein [Halomicrobium urmianum]